MLNKDEVDIKFARYENGATGIQLVSKEDGSLYSVATVNVDLFEFEMMVNSPDGERFVIIKNYSENEGMDNFLKQGGFIDEEPMFLVQVGHVQCPLHSLTDKSMAMLHEQLGVRQPKTEEDIKREQEEFQQMLDSL